MITRRESLKRSVLAGLGFAITGSRALRGEVVTGEATPDILGPGSLKAHATTKQLLVGCAVGAEQLQNDTTFRKLVPEQFDLVVAENCMKFAALRPAPDAYSFRDADALVAFAEQHQIKVRGHNFVWHEALPKWFAATVTPENAKQFLTEHIITVGQRYKGRIHSWDVVNEAIHVKDGRPDGLRKSPWLERLGPDYIDLAFRTARQADPHARLAYNDFGIEYDTPEDQAKRSALLAMLRRMRANGVPIDALGIQSHIKAGSSKKLGEGLQNLIAAAEALKLDVYITELDVNDDDVQQDGIAERDQAVSAVYGEYLTDVLESRAVKAVLTWGVTDSHTWLNGTHDTPKKHPDRLERCLPFDAEYRPKPAFFAMRDAIDKAPQR